MGMFHTALLLYSSSLCIRGSLHINDMHGNHLVSILEKIPQKPIDDFFDTLRISFVDFKETDTKKAGPNHTYPSAHGDVYGRYTNRVSAPLFTIHISG